MPKDGDPDEIVDPYLHSIQWSRRSMGLKIYLPLMIHGWSGYERIIDIQIELGDYFKNLLVKNGWKMVNRSSLPIICFTREDIELNKGISQLVQYLNNSGKTWVSEYAIKGQVAVRVCINNYSTTSNEVNELIELLQTYHAE